MKKVFLALSCLGLLWTGCKEHDTAIDFGKTSVSDTSYVLSTVPAAGPHEVLIEEFTGQSCSACPSAHNQLESLASQNSGRINVIGLYITNFGQTTPPTGAIYDFRDTNASHISSQIYNGVGSLPSAGIDRTLVSGNILLYQSVWSSTIASRLLLQDSVNVSVQSTFDTGSKTATIVAQVTYLNNTTTNQYLAIAIVEDSMVDKQEDGTAPSGFDDNYVFTNVFRSMVTSVPFGDALGTGGPKVAGTLFQKVYRYKLKNVTPAMKPEHCKVIAYVNSNNAGDYHVVQSAHCSLK